MRDHEFNAHRVKTEKLTGYGAGIAIDENLTLVGNITQTGNQALTGNIVQTGNQTITGNIVLTGGLSTTAMPTIPTATVAATGSTQANGALIATGFTLVTAADATKAIKLPAAAAGLQCIIKNGANAALPIFPNTDDAINAIAANSALTIAALTSVMLVAYDATTWYSLPLVAS